MIVASRPRRTAGAAAPRLPMLLLHLFAVSLLASILAGTALALYWSFSGEVSKHRQRMNTAAASAQVYFNRNEALLRSLAASTVRDAGGAAPTAGDANPAALIPLPKDNGAHDWALILTPRGRADLAAADASIVYAPAGETASKRLLLHPPLRTAPLSPQAGAWLSKALAMQDPAPTAGGRAAIAWLHPPMDGTESFFVYTPLDETGRERTWIGLEVGGIATAIASECARDGGSYALYDGQGRVLLHGGALPPIPERVASRHGPDAIGIHGEGWIPDTLILARPVGAAGWRLAYYVPLADVLRHGAAALWTAGAICLLLVIALVLAVRHIKGRLVEPALKQYEALADSVALNEKIIETAPVGLSLVRRADGKLILSNVAARRLLGEHDGWREDIRRATAATGSREYLLKDGRSVSLTFAAMTYRSEDVMLCGVSDVTGQKEIERTLRSAKLTADRASEAKTMFLATISHEIRTPLYGILGTLELLALTDLSGQQQQYLNNIQQSSSTLLRTINDTLDLSRIEAGHQELDVTEFSPSDILDRVVANYAARAQGKGLLIYAVTALGVPAAVLGDASRILQVLNNLVSNAVKFTETGRVVLRASAVAPYPGRITLRFQVADTGVGIPADSLAQLFEPYFRAHADQESGISGTGLGLAICRRLADLMGGALSVVSQEGKGTSIVFTLTLDTPRMTMPVALQRRPVYVDGAVPEVVANLCGWLNTWGADALAYREYSDTLRGKTPLPEDAVLVQAWPHAAGEPAWTRRRVLVLAPGSGHEAPEPAVSQGAIASTSNPISIGRAVRLAQGGVERPAPWPADGARAAIADAAGRPPQALPPSRAPLDLRVLVAEDNPINQMTIRGQLEQLGCRIAIAPDGVEALAMWETQHFDLILTDVNMPRMNGYELASTLRSRGAAIPIIGVTANAMKEEETRCMAAGMNGWLLKPVDLHSLWLRLHPLAGASADSAAARAAPIAPAPRAAGQVPLLPAKYLGLFTQTMTQDLAALERCVAEADEPGIQAMLHRIRGALAAVELTGLQNRAERLEDQLRSNGLNAESQRELAALTADMKAMLAAL
ncbi:response regulator [Achromobacter denitrificans]